jgi:hypothetical protein
MSFCKRIQIDRDAACSCHPESQSGEGPHTGSRITLVASSVSQRVDVRSLIVYAIRDDNAFVYAIRDLSRCFENDLAADDGHYATRVQNFRLRNLHDVLRKDGEIGKLTGFD